MKELLLCLSVVALTFASCSEGILFEEILDTEVVNQDKFSAKTLDNQYIVQLKPGTIVMPKNAALSYPQKLQLAKTQVEQRLNVLPKGTNIELQHVYFAAINGFAAKLTQEEVALLDKLPFVTSIEQDQIGRIVSQNRGSSQSFSSTQSVEYGVLRTGYGNGSGKRAFIIDSGIDLDHEDLNVNTDLGVDFVNEGGGLFGGGGGLFGGGGSTPKGDDDNGHGTHCAGIVAAIDNNIGVVGVAAGAEVVAVKVINFLGNCNATDVLQGIDYVADVGEAGDVANLSLSFIGTQQAINNAVIALGSQGVFVAIAAGNNSQDANNESPAMANGTNVYTVSALDINDDFASFSNYGNPPVDFCAPGVDTYSTYTNNGYNTISGTSMAAPHVAGILLLNNGTVNSDGFVQNDPDNDPDPIAHL